MLHGELLPLITEIENEKIIFQINDVAIRIAANIKKVASRFLNRIIAMASIDSAHLNVIDNLCGILAREVYDQEK